MKVYTRVKKEISRKALISVFVVSIFMTVTSIIGPCFMQRMFLFLAGNQLCVCVRAILWMCVSIK